MSSPGNSKFVSKLLLLLKSKDSLNVIKITLGTGFYAIVLFILRSVIGNNFGPDHLGIYSLLFIIYTFGFQFIAMGMGVTLTKYISEISDDIEQTKKLIGFGLSVSALSGILFSAISIATSKLLAISLFHDETVYLSIIIVSLSFPFISLLQTSLGTLNGLFKITKYTVSYLILTFLTLITTLLGIFLMDNPAIGYSLGLSLPTVVTSIITLFFVVYKFGFKISLKVPKRKKLLQFALLTVIINSIAFINNQITSIILASHLTTLEVGILSAALTLVQGLLIFPYAAQRIVMPRVSRLYAENKWQEIRNFNRKSVLVVILTYSFFAVLLTIVARPIVNLIFSTDFSDSVVLIWILMPTSIIYSLNATLGGVLAAIEKLNVNVVINGVLSVLTLILGLVLVIYLGTIGAAIATAIFYCLSTAVVMITLYHFRAL
jgi:O-antigen/teichoic acid export membrane protein